MIDDLLDHRMLGIDGTHDEVAAKAVSTRAAGDVVDIEVCDRRGDFVALPVDDGVVDQGAVDGGHGGGLIMASAGVHRGAEKSAIRGCVGRGGLQRWPEGLGA